MGLKRIEFFWYTHRIEPLAMAKYFFRVTTYIVQYRLLHGARLFSSKWPLVIINQELF